jgi:lipoyl(octanoyl) transferase
MRIEDLGTMRYCEGWGVQQQVHAEVVGGGEERVLLVEHPPVITLGRRAGVNENLLATEEQLRQLGVEVVQSDRGGDITFHGPGQIVAYPIIRLNEHKLSVGGYVRRLEETVIGMLREDFGIAGQKDACAVGVWVPMGPGDELAKICAIGVRIRRGVLLHGLGLNVETDLKYFQLIVGCGLKGRAVTSMRQILGDGSPGINVVKEKLGQRLRGAFS